MIRISALRSIATICVFSVGCVFSAGLASVASAQNTRSNAPSTAAGQSPATQPTPQARQQSFNGVTPYQAFGYRLTVDAPAPVSYLGSAYRNDLSGQSESNSDPALDESVRGEAPSRIEAW